MRSKYKWLEAWVDFSSDRHYVLLVRERLSGKIEIVDPAEDNKVIHEFDNYEDAVHWLREDEYDQIEGRGVLDEDGGVTFD
ncbi:hypothetical protein [Polyangium jinanense]|uniref:Uncharacterized protein n=1 Tax=Polyangium jinanense TaxID=2829994 RepID=A0A9X4AX78_9BACT|nr:hypothetical protein [Polyangium jinanense]MDC3959770.1 hypothetical protein [Polyangium jinanense]MDC3988084.1 hypothetical protein [Polyangium jinanense]